MNTNDSLLLCRHIIYINLWPSDSIVFNVKLIIFEFSVARHVTRS